MTLSRTTFVQRPRGTHVMNANIKAAPPSTIWTPRSISLAMLVVSMVAVTVCMGQGGGALRNLFGPGSVVLREAYESTSSGPSFDHSNFDALLKKHVDADGWVDYEGFNKDAASLDAYIDSLAAAPFVDLDRDEKLAFLINAYNAFTLRLILDHYPIKSIKDIPKAKRWDAKRWHIGKQTLSLNQIEHEQIRPKFAEPRIHFALVCAAIGCPPLRNEAYRADQIDKQLEAQTRYVHTHDRWLRHERNGKVVRLSKLYDWYGSDFKQVAGSVLEFAARYAPSLKAAMTNGKPPRIAWLDYDWTLNDIKNKR